MRVVHFFLDRVILAQSQPAAQPAKNIKEVVTMQVDTAKNLIDMIIEFIVRYSFQALGGIIVLFLGWIAARMVADLFFKFLEKKDIDVTVAKFMAGGVKLIIMGFAVIVALGKFGIEIAPLIAGISVVGFGTSFALQGPLSNYASGATLIFTKPFKVGDIIEVAGVVGEVTDMKLPRTEIKTIDGHTIVVPNKHIIGEIIHNYSLYKRLDVMVGISYKSNVDQAIRLVENVLKNEPRVVKDKIIKVGIEKFGESSIDLMARVWCKQDDYWNVLFDVNKKIWDEFQKNNIEIPFPQRDVHIYPAKGKDQLS